MRARPKPAPRVALVSPSRNGNPRQTRLAAGSHCPCSLWLFLARTHLRSFAARPQSGATASSRETRPSPPIGRRLAKQGEYAFAPGTLRKPTRQSPNPSGCGWVSPTRIWNETSRPRSIWQRAKAGDSTSYSATRLREAFPWLNLLMVPVSRTSPPQSPRSNPPQQEQDNQNGQHHAQSAAWVITPTPAVRPGGESAEQHQNKQDYQSSS